MPRLRGQCPARQTSLSGSRPALSLEARRAPSLRAYEMKMQGRDGVTIGTYYDAGWRLRATWEVSTGLRGNFETAGPRRERPDIALWRSSRKRLPVDYSPSHLERS